MEFTNVQYTSIDGTNTGIKADLDGETLHIPLVVGNIHYDEVMKQVSEGTLTIADAVYTPIENSE